jgi:hypothetical protein
MLQRERARLQEWIRQQREHTSELSKEWGENRQIELGIEGTLATLEKIRQIKEESAAEAILESSRSKPLDYAKEPLFPTPPLLLVCVALGMLIALFVGGMVCYLRRARVPTYGQLIRSGRRVHDSLEEIIEFLSEEPRKILLVAGTSDESVLESICERYQMNSPVVVDCDETIGSGEHLRGVLEKKIYGGERKSISFRRASGYPDHTPVLFQMATLIPTLLQEMPEDSMVILWTRQSIRELPVQRLIPQVDAALIFLERETLEELPSTLPNTLYSRPHD